MKERCSYHEDQTMTHQFEAQHEGEMLLSGRSYNNPFNLKHNMKEICSYHEDHTFNLKHNMNERCSYHEDHTMTRSI
jgi:hypothetical protein